MTPTGIQDGPRDVDRRSGDAGTTTHGGAKIGGAPHWRGIALFVALVALAPTPALAHVKWFEDESRYPVRVDLVFSGRTGILIVVCGAALALLYGLQRSVGDPHWPNLRVFKGMAIGTPTLLAVQAAIGLAYAAVQPTLFAPNLRLHPTALGLALVAIQILIAFSFITGIGDWIGALALIALVPLAFLLFPPFDVADLLFWAGIGVIVLVIGRQAVEGGKVKNPVLHQTL